MTDEPDMNIISNRVVEFVNASNDFLFAKELQITCDEGSPANAQKFIDDTWGRKETRIPFLLRLGRSEEHTSEFQSPDHLLCRLLLQKKKLPPHPLPIF